MDRKRDAAAHGPGALTSVEVADDRIQTEVVDDPPTLQRYRASWERLAVASGRAYCSPAWLLPWWTYVAPPDADLCVVLVLLAGQLIGLAPWFTVSGRLGLRLVNPLGLDTCARVAPLAAPGFEQAVAAHVARAVAGLRQAPDLVCFDGIDGRDWPTRLARGWPGGPARQLVRYENSAPFVDLRGGDFAAWYASRSKKFRSSTGTRRRGFARRGGVVRLAGPDTLERDLAAFARVHYARWEARGGSKTLNPAVERMLLEAAQELLPSGRLRLWVLEADGDVVAASLSVVAGRTYGCWLYGFDERHPQRDLSTIAKLVQIEDAFSLGAERVDLGAGGTSWKRRFSDGEDVLSWVRVVAPGPRRPLAFASLLPGQLRRNAAQRLPDTIRVPLQRTEQRLRGEGAARQRVDEGSSRSLGTRRAHHE